MNILMVNKFLYPKTGVETYFLKIGNCLKKHGHEVEYFGIYDERNIVGNNWNIYVKNVDSDNKIIKKILYPFKIINNFMTKIKIKKIIKRFKPDIIHLNNISLEITQIIIQNANKMNISVVQTIQNYQKMFVENFTAKKMETYKKIDMYICQSTYIEKQLLQNEIFKGKTKKMISFIESKSEIKRYEKENYILYFGELTKEKGFDIFLDVCKKMPQIKFKVIGDGSLGNLCKYMDNITYEGVKKGKELNELIGKARVSVFPANWYENCNLDILKSISLGTPVIASNKGGMREILKNNKTAILLPKITEGKIKSAIYKLSKNKDLLKELIKNCFKERKEMITLEKYCKELEEVYKSLINN